MSSSFAHLLQQKRPQFQTNKALIVIGLQNDFCSPNGKLPVTQPPALLDRIKRLVPAFREHAGHVIWVRTELQPNQPAEDADDADAIVTSVPDESASSEDDGCASAELTLDDLTPTSGARRRPSDLLKRIQARSRKAEKDADAAQDDEFFLTQGAPRQICAAGSPGADWADDIAAEIKSEDTLVTKNRYSALKGTTLLLTLRSKLVTELYVCGCISNISVYATAVEAARHGIEIYLVDDCVGYRKLNRHREAIRQMVEYMGAQIVSSTSLIAQLTGKAEKGDTSQGSKAETDHDLGDMLNNLKVKDKDGHPCRGSSSPPKPTKDPTPPPQANAVAVSANPLEVADSDDALLDETTLLMERHPIGSRLPAEQQPPPRSSGSVRSKVRMRRKPSQKSQSPPEKGGSSSKEKQNPGAESTKSGQNIATSRPKPISSGSSSSESFQTPTPKPEMAKPAGDTADSSRTEAVASQSLKKAPQAQRSRMAQSLATLPTLGPSDNIGEGDSQILYDFLPPSLRASTGSSKPIEEVIFDKLYNEVRWQKMTHAQGEVPRLVSVQGDFSPDGSVPIYRHPADESLPLLHFSPAVLRVRKRVEELAKHPVNHVLIQLYRGGQDYISEHSDKMKLLYRALGVLSIAALAAADPDGLTNCGDTSTVPGLIGENTTVSFPIAGTCKTVIANYADGSEESISVEHSGCHLSSSPSASQVYQIAFGSLSPRGVASILFNCNGGLQVFCQRYNITTGDGGPAQDTTNITAMCNETTTYPSLSPGGSPSGLVAATPPVSAGQPPSTLLTAASTPLQGPHGTTGSGSATERPAGSGRSQERSAEGTSGQPSSTEATSPTSLHHSAPQASNGGGMAPGDGGGGTSDGGSSGTSDGGGSVTSDGGGSTTSDGGGSTTSDGGGSTTSDGGGSTTSDGGGSATLGANTSPSSAIPSITAAAGESTRSPINTPNFPYTPLTPQSSCTCTC